MTRVIFLDIDGPMIPVRAMYLPQQTLVASVFDPCAVALLNRLLLFSEAKLVISSTWRHKGKDPCVQVLEKNGINPAVLHEHWDTPRKMSSTRTEEIRMWLDRHPEVKHYVAIDDEQLDFELLPSAVQCDAHEGFSWRNYLECCVHLDAYEHPDTDSRSKFLEQIQYFKRREIWRTKRRNEPGSSLTHVYADELFPRFEEAQE